MKDSKSLSHTRWNCKYHIVFAPKYRRQVIYGKIKNDLGTILRRVCEYKGIEILEASLCKDLCTHASEHSAEIQRVINRRVSEGEEQPNDIRPPCELEVQVWKSAVLVYRILRRYGRSQQKGDTGVHSESNTGRYCERSNIAERVTDPFTGEPVKKGK